MLLSLWLPVVLTAVALFFASFLSWVVLPLHKPDWVKAPNEDALLDSLRSLELKTGSYAFPGYSSSQEMNSDGFRQKWETGPCGVLTIFPRVSMARNLALTFLYFLVVSVCLAALATLAIDAGAGFPVVFRFVAPAAALAYLTAIVQHAIWFHCRIVGHVVESLVYAAITGAIFASLWPAA